MASNKVLSVDRGQYNNSANIHIQEKKNKEYQKFYIEYDAKEKCYTITAVHSEKVLDVNGALQDNGTNVAQYESNNTDAQKWILKKTEDGSFNIISKCNELCLDVNGASKANGANIQTYQNNGTKAQKFQFEKAEINIGTQTIEDGIYNIIPKLNNNKVIEMEEQSTSDNKKIQIAKKLNVINKSQGFKVEYLDNGYYLIKALKADKPLEVENGEQTNGAKVQQKQNDYYKIQQWIIKEASGGYYYIISRCNGLYLDVPDGKATDGKKLQMYEGNNTNAQMFKFEKREEVNLVSEKTIEDGWYVIKSKLNQNKVLDVSAGNYNNSANIQIWDKAKVQQQKFYVKYNTEGKYYEIQSVNSGKYLDVNANGQTDGTNVIQYEKNNSIAQRWVIQKADNNSYYLIAKNSNLYLDVSGGKTSNGTNIQIYEGNESNSQKFIFEPVSVIDEDEYKISIKKDLSKSLDVSEGSNAENANVQIWTTDNVNQQVFKIENVNVWYCKITAKHSNKVLTATSDNNVVQNSYNGSDNQHWIIEALGRGDYKIRSKATGLYLDVDSNKTNNGTNIQVYEKNDTEAQVFQFNKLTIRKGIDVSKYNGDINWQIVKMFGGVDYAIIRAGYRGYRTGKIVQDDYFIENITGARDNGIDMGLYFYTQATNTQEAVEEANYVINLVKKYNLSLRYPIYIDTEWSTADADNPGRADNLDRNTRTAVCKAFCDTIKSNGYISGIYASKYWYYNNLNESQLNQYEIWVAHYTGDENKRTDYKYKYDMWQYTSSGCVPGINTLVDMNICYKTY